MFVMQGLCVFPLQNRFRSFMLMFKKKSGWWIYLTCVCLPLSGTHFWPDDWIMGKAEMLWDLRHIPRGLIILVPVHRCSNPRNVRGFCLLLRFFLSSGVAAGKYIILSNLGLWITATVLVFLGRDFFLWCYFIPYVVSRKL